MEVGKNRFCSILGRGCFFLFVCFLAHGCPHWNRLCKQVELLITRILATEVSCSAELLETSQALDSVASTIPSQRNEWISFRMSTAPTSCDERNSREVRPGTSIPKAQPVTPAWLGVSLTPWVSVQGVSCCVPWWEHCCHYSLYFWSFKLDLMMAGTLWLLASKKKA